MNKLTVDLIWLSIKILGLLFSSVAFWEKFQAIPAEEL